MSLLKQRISSPLEAGTSILDSQSIPLYFNDALEYISKRLARKALHVTLIVVRKEYQVPSSCATPTSSSASSPTEFEFIMPSSPSRFASPVASIRQLVRRGTNCSLASVSSAASVDSGYGSTASSTYSSPSTRKWPATPCTPMTPHTPSSATTATSTTSNVSTGGPNHLGIRLIHATLLSAKDEKTLRTIFYKAERKYRAGTGWLPPATTATACGLSGDLIRRSLLQNEVLFSAEGLTLLGLDRLYTFKAALSAYARTTLPASSLTKPLILPADRMMEDAVDELRRLVLANGGRPINKADLHRRYEWIGVSASALSDVERMYRRAYGGCGRVGAFKVTAEDVGRVLLDLAPPPSPPSHTLYLPFAAQDVPIVKIGTPPCPKGPVLKLHTKFDDNKSTLASGRQSNVNQHGIFRPVPTKAVATRAKGEEAHKPQKQSRQEEGDFMDLEITLDGLDITSSCADEEDGDGDLTARPFTTGRPFWNSVAAAEASSSIDEMMMMASQKHLSPLVTADSHRYSRLSVSSASRHEGPLTPNGYDDISPITRGEWGFLFAGDRWSRPRQGPVETC
ncbi:hypothetical protein PG996_001235 [Apiospora saccharicola]|uniref:DUF7582 domain-containing protein n=1 Tax=Apiospora saccharicola TaxID=335842 RepID=A0ABR1WG19_9PEZI